MQELRVAARSFHHRRQRVWWQRVQFGDGAAELHRPVGREGLGFDDHGVGRDVVREPLRPRTPTDAEEPGAPVEMIGDVAQQVGRRVVHVVDVFDLDQRGLIQDPFEERGDRFVQPGAQELLAQHLDLLRRGDSIPNGCPMSGNHGAAPDPRSRPWDTSGRARRRRDRRSPHRAAPAAVLATPCTPWDAV